MGMAKRNVNVLVKTRHEGEQYSFEQCDYNATEAFLTIISKMFMMLLNKVVHVQISTFKCKLAMNEREREIYYNILWPYWPFLQMNEVNIVVTNVTLRVLIEAFFAVISNLLMMVLYKIIHAA